MLKATSHLLPVFYRQQATIPGNQVVLKANPGSLFSLLAHTMLSTGYHKNIHV